MGRKEWCRFWGSNSFGEDELKKWLNSMWWYCVCVYVEKLSCTTGFLGEGQCPEVLVDSPLSMAYSPSPLIAQWMIWAILLKTKNIFLCSVFVVLFNTVFLFCLNCRCNCYQNPENDLTKTQEKHSNQKASPEVNNTWSNKISCSVAHFCVIFLGGLFFCCCCFFCSTGIFFFPFLNDESCKKWTAVCTCFWRINVLLKYLHNLCILKY